MRDDLTHAVLGTAGNLAALVFFLGIVVIFIGGVFWELCRGRR